MIKKADCCGHKPHSQDELHGKGNRVFNETKFNDKIVIRCTVCGKEEIRSTK